jgi:hypothetical protein
MAAMSEPALPANVRLRDAVAADTQGIWRVHARAIRASAASHYTEDELDAWVERVQPETYLGLLGWSSPKPRAPGSSASSALPSYCPRKP